MPDSQPPIGLMNARQAEGLGMVILGAILAGVPFFVTLPAQAGLLLLSFLVGCALLLVGTALSPLPRRAKVFLFFAVPFGLLYWIFDLNATLMERRALMAEGRTGLDRVYQAARAFKQSSGTYEIGDRGDLAIQELRAERYSFWYAVKGKPQMLRGSATLTAPCDLTTPPITVAVAASQSAFVAAAKGNLDGDPTCDEWSINELGEQRHNLKDLHQ